MEFIKILFKDDDKVIGLCSIKKKLKRITRSPRNSAMQHFFTVQTLKIIFSYPKQYNLVPRVGSPNAFS